MFLFCVHQLRPFPIPESREFTLYTPFKGVRFFSDVFLSINTFYLRTLEADTNYALPTAYFAFNTISLQQQRLSS